MTTKATDPLTVDGTRGAGDEVQAAANDLQETASGLLDQAGRTAETQASKTMTTAGDTLETVARAVRDAGSGVRDEQPQIADFADTAANQVERAARYLRDHDASELVDEAGRFARQQPAIVIGGALLAGIAVGRLLKSSSSSSGSTRSGTYGTHGSTGRYGTYGRAGEDRYPSTGYGTGYGGGTRYESGPRAGYTGKPTDPAGVAGGTGSAGISTSARTHRTGTGSDMTHEASRPAGGLGATES